MLFAKRTFKVLFIYWRKEKIVLEHANNFRLLKLREVLFQETDEDHELSLDELREKVLQLSPERAYDRRTVKKDLAVLEQAGFDIVKNKGKYGKILYSHQSRLFELYQLRLLVDAILSARFITSGEKENLIDKVKQLTSKHMAKTLPGPILFSQSANIDYDLVKVNIDHVHRAISERKVLAYQYGKFNVDKQFVFNRDGAIYYVEPYALIWQNDFYYLIGRFQQTNEIRHYRLDRIRNIEITDETFKKEDFHLQAYVNQSFHMFAGEESRIKILFHNGLVNVVLDRFGPDADIQKYDDEHFILSAKAKLSDGLVNWILTWGDQAKVMSPDSLVCKVKEKVTAMYNIYRDE